MVHIRTDDQRPHHIHPSTARDDNSSRTKITRESSTLKILDKMIVIALVVELHYMHVRGIYVR